MPVSTAQRRTTETDRLGPGVSKPSITLIVLCFPPSSCAYDLESPFFSFSPQILSVPSKTFRRLRNGASRLLAVFPILFSGIQDAQPDGEGRGTPPSALKQEVFVLYLSFLIQLIAGSALPILLFAILEMPLFGLVALTFPLRDRNAPLKSHAVAGLHACGQAYLWFGWAAYCASLTITIAADPRVSDPWVYYLTALFVANVPIAFLRVKEKMAVDSEEELSRLRGGSNLCRGITVVGFSLFCLTPQLMTTPYGWFVEVREEVRDDGAHDNSVKANVEKVVQASERMNRLPLTPSA